ncbi:MOSC domain-containing protein [Indiicoccus explosivorum]|uniref:MOSC domain-containing protein n=1 Tax=Indiicoccus explosivorum TaxID=1917864 RepID=UPI000B45174B|nr:MOSC domain-containing protein [Indiicoccus explosivorum]
MKIGSVAEIVRHPVKSFRGETVQAVRLMDYGLLGDRSHALLEEERPGRYLTITQYPGMARWRAEFAGEDSLDRYPDVRVVSPDGRVFRWGDGQLLAELSRLSGRRVSFVSYTPQEVPLGAIEEEPVQLVSRASVAEMERLWGEGAIDWRRFRPNLLLDLDGNEPFREEQWYGRTMRIGPEAAIRLERPCERCMIITVDPDTADKSPSLLKTVAKKRQNRFGVYGTVVKTGMIRTGDELMLED